MSSNEKLCFTKQHQSPSCAHKLKIAQNEHGKTEIFLDDFQLKGVLKYSVVEEARKSPILILKLRIHSVDKLS